MNVSGKALSNLWEALGEIDEEETGLVLTKLFEIYEQILEQDPNSSEAVLFFNKLELAISQTSECNLNRR